MEINRLQAVSGHRFRSVRRRPVDVWFRLAGLFAGRKLRADVWAGGRVHAPANPSGARKVFWWQRRAVLPDQGLTNESLSGKYWDTTLIQNPMAGPAGSSCPESTVFFTGLVA